MKYLILLLILFLIPISSAQAKTDPVVTVTKNYLNALRVKDYNTACKYTVTPRICVREYKKLKLSIKTYRIYGNSSYYKPYYTIRVFIDGVTGIFVWQRINSKLKLIQVVAD